MSAIKAFLFLVIGLAAVSVTAQIVVKMDMPEQSDQPLEVVALFDEEIPEGIPVVLGLMGYDIEGGMTPFLFEWLLNGEVVSTNDIVIFTPNKGDDLSLKVTDNNKCSANTTFNLKFASIPQSPNADAEIEIYPTIVADYINIDLPKSENKKALIRIFTVNGKIVHKKYILGSTRVNLNLTPGIYFVSVRIGEIHKIEKIIAQ